MATCPAFLFDQVLVLRQLQAVRSQAPRLLTDPCNLSLLPTSHPLVDRLAGTACVLQERTGRTIQHSRLKVPPNGAVRQRRRKAGISAGRRVCGRLGRAGRITRRYQMEVGQSGVVRPGRRSRLVRTGLTTRGCQLKVARSGALLDRYGIPVPPSGSCLQYLEFFPLV